MRLALTALSAIALPLLSGCVIVPGLGGLGRDTMEEVTLVEAERFFTRDKFLLVDISGALSTEREQTWLGEGTSLVEDVHDALALAREDESIRALILRIDSPGGTVTASDMLHHEITQYAEESGVPTVAVLMDVAASGGYYVACAADTVVAHPTTVTGSIGVLLITLNVEGLEQLVGVEVGAITSGRHKDILSPFRDMTDEERAMLQAMIDEMHETFVGVVAEGRPGLAEEDLRNLADGRIFTAEQAREAGLVDEIAHLSDVVDALREQQGLDDVRVVSYRRGPAGDYNLYSRAPGPPVVNVDLIDAGAVTQGLRPGFHYLWLPGL